jgi:hypothetical protein
MEGLITVKASDLTELFDAISSLRKELKEMREAEESTKAYSIKQTADMLSLHYNSVRNLIISGKLFAKYLHDDYGKSIVPLWSIKVYLLSKENSNQQ